MRHAGLFALSPAVGVAALDLMSSEGRAGTLALTNAIAGAALFIGSSDTSRK